MMYRRPYWTVCISWRRSFGGEDTSGLQFLHQPGFTLFTVQLPRYAIDFSEANWLIVVVPIVLAAFARKGRFLLALVPVLFFIGHGYVIVTGWHYYYGYGSAPAAHVLIVLTGAAVGMLFDARRLGAGFAGVAVLLGALYLFTADPRYNFYNYFNNSPLVPGGAHLYVYHGTDLVRYW